jgi:hypothetical protein
MTVREAGAVYAGDISPIRISAARINHGPGT